VVVGSHVTLPTHLRSASMAAISARARALLSAMLLAAARALAAYCCFSSPRCWRELWMSSVEDGGFFFCSC
jgi:hypothetical protein